MDVGWVERTHLVAANGVRSAGDARKRGQKGLSKGTCARGPVQALTTSGCWLQLLLEAAPPCWHVSTGVDGCKGVKPLLNYTLLIIPSSASAAQVPAWVCFYIAFTAN